VRQDSSNYNASEDRIYLQNTDPGDTSRITLGSSNDSSNLISALGWTNAVQYTNGSGSTELKSTQPLGAVRTDVKLQDLILQGGAITGGSFSIYGLVLILTLLLTRMQLFLSRINASEAGVIASYDATTDTLHFVSEASGSRLNRFGNS
jgi:hypothetical protein